MNTTTNVANVANFCSCGSRATTEVSAGWDNINNCGAYEPICDNCYDIETGHKLPIQDEVYLKQLVKEVSKCAYHEASGCIVPHPEASEIVELALRGKRRDKYITPNYYRGRETGHYQEVELTYPIQWISEVNKMTTEQYLASRQIAKYYNHLWAWFDGTKNEQATQWANHYNLGGEIHHQSEHSLPVSADHTSSNRFSWEVEKSGKVVMRINRPQGTAITIEGKLDETPIVKIHHGITQDRHLKCLYQRLMFNWNLSSKDAIEVIESARGYDKLGIRFGELANIVVDANW